MARSAGSTSQRDTPVCGPKVGLGFRRVGQQGLGYLQRYIPKSETQSLNWVTLQPKGDHLEPAISDGSPKIGDQASLASLKLPLRSPPPLPRLAQGAGPSAAARLIRGGRAHAWSLPACVDTASRVAASRAEQGCPAGEWILGFGDGGPDAPGLQRGEAVEQLEKTEAAGRKRRLPESWGRRTG